MAEPDPIGSHGLLGDTRTAALVDTQGSIDWLCLPHFDCDPATLARSGSATTIVPSMSPRSSRVSPASWAPIMTAVSTPVAISPNEAQPIQSIGPVTLILGPSAGRRR